MSHIVSQSELETALSGLSEWTVEENTLVRKIAFPSFRDAGAAIVRISFEAEDTNHHPELINCYNSLEIRLSTHDAGGKITDKDLRLAALIEEVVDLKG